MLRRRHGRWGVLNGATDDESKLVAVLVAIDEPELEPEREPERKSFCESDQQAVALAVETGRHVAADVKPERKAVVQPERVPLDVTLVESKRRGSLRRRLCGRAH